MNDKLKNSIQKINRSIEDLYYPNYLINRAVDYSKIYNLNSYAKKETRNQK